MLQQYIIIAVKLITMAVQHPSFIKGKETDSFSTNLVVSIIFFVDSMYPSSPINIIVAQQAAMMAPARLPRMSKNYSNVPQHI